MTSVQLKRECKSTTQQIHTDPPTDRQMRNVYAFKLILFSSFHVELSFCWFVRLLMSSSSSQSSFVCWRNFPDILPYLSIYQFWYVFVHTRVELYGVFLSTYFHWKYFHFVDSFVWKYIPMVLAKCEAYFEMIFW